jgi:hypothetical protein
MPTRMRKQPTAVVLASLAISFASVSCSEAQRRDVSPGAPDSRAHPTVDASAAPAADGGEDSGALPNAREQRDAGRVLSDPDIGADAGGRSGAPVAACLADLFASCPLTGACHSARDDDAGVRTECFASGLTSTTEVQNDGCRSGRYVTYTSEVRSADGALCYTTVSEVDCTQAEEAGETTWKDRHGDSVATLRFTYGSQTLSCSASGETQTCKQPCSLTGQPSSGCEPGSCPGQSHQN